MQRTKILVLSIAIAAIATLVIVGAVSAQIAQNPTPTIGVYGQNQQGNTNSYGYPANSGYSSYGYGYNYPINGYGQGGCRSGMRGGMMGGYYP